MNSNTPNKMTRPIDLDWEKLEGLWVVWNVTNGLPVGALDDALGAFSFLACRDEQECREMCEHQTKVWGIACEPRLFRGEWSTLMPQTTHP